ncbi:hypothetical protein B0T16DRAFT_145313 [Cercophora newfieldiana]|uniref:GPI anchored cell wall protein n=1 Tax=Cercophora newfieldiana TaxID=92897 RepID=A0AA39Y446_9PEZI|nr:hypothetical protein B0T16DRAFT_145313 [Cercophora newfieldiana]
MHHPSTLLLLSAAAARLAAAQSSIVTSALMPLGSDVDVYGSVVGVGSGLTTIALNCPYSTSSVSGTVFDPCGSVFKATVYLGPSTVSGEQVYTQFIEETNVSVTQEIRLGCVLGTKDATCTGTMTQQGTLTRGTTTSTVSSEEVQSTVIEDWTTEAAPLTITGGLEKLTAAPTGTGTGGAGGAGSSGSSSSNAGAPMVTARAVLVGVAAMVAAL